MTEIATLPRTPKERAQKATFIQTTLDANKLSKVWLMHQLLIKEGFKIQPQTVTSVMSGALVSPKGDEFLMRAERICKDYKYRQSLNISPQSEI